MLIFLQTVTLTILVSLATAVGWLSSDSLKPLEQVGVVPVGLAIGLILLASNYLCLSYRRRYLRVLERERVSERRLGYKILCIFCIPLAVLFMIWGGVLL